jgi:molybdate transport system ATP-binding protein
VTPYSTATIDIDVAIQRPALEIQAKFALPAQGITAVIGRSGSGKSSVLHALAGLLTPTRGHVKLSGQTLFDHQARINLQAHERAWGVVFQEGRLFPHLSVRGNLLFGDALSSRPAGPAFGDVVELLGVGALLTRRPHTLSGGERQRVAIGRALLSRPRALLMDEPLASLDPARRHELLGYLATLPARYGLPLIYVTHQMDEVLRLADHVVVMNDGRSVAAGAALDVLGDLNVQPLIGRFEAGSVLAGVVHEQLSDWQLTCVQVAGQKLTVPQITAPVGAGVRLRIRARDVALLSEVTASHSSASNQLQACVLQVLDRDGPYCIVELALSLKSIPLGDQPRAGETLWALVTRRSVSTMGLRAGQTVVASFKAVAVEGRSVAAFG